MRLINRLLPLFIIFLLAGVVACTKKKDIENTNAVKLAGDWYVEFLDSASMSDIFGIGVVRFATYNTADDNNEIWVDDMENTWEFKTKAVGDLTNLTFTATESEDLVHGVTVNIRNGKVIPNGGHSKTGVVVDSIYMEVEFSDDPGTTYVITGNKRTGFFEDEY